MSCAACTLGGWTHPTSSPTIGGSRHPQPKPDPGESHRLPGTHDRDVAALCGILQGTSAGSAHTCLGYDSPSRVTREARERCLPVFDRSGGAVGPVPSQQPTHLVGSASPGEKEDLRREEMGEARGRKERQDGRGGRLDLWLLLRLLLPRLLLLGSRLLVSRPLAPVYQTPGYYHPKYFTQPPMPAGAGVSQACCGHAPRNSIRNTWPSVKSVILASAGRDKIGSLTRSRRFRHNNALLVSRHSAAFLTPAYLLLSFHHTTPITNQLGFSVSIKTTDPHPQPTTLHPNPAQSNTHQPPTHSQPRPGLWSPVVPRSHHHHSANVRGLTNQHRDSDYLNVSPITTRHRLRPVEPFLNSHHRQL
ncbi:hypothetical protein GWK47_044144 [Chionoecetes opilio]|uniref:Uncharacterized protein n=1 Tax=Chionoecetes opilio TaxID=41210 RepID=A0A8J5CY97_CHIOP|nr:hypothetical protein GWK47_044144 [Chionoecetes opilio]